MKLEDNHDRACELAAKQLGMEDAEMVKLTSIPVLETILRGIIVECDRCKDGYILCGYPACQVIPYNCKHSNTCDIGTGKYPCTCTNGRISLYTKLKREVGG